MQQLFSKFNNNFMRKAVFLWLIFLTYNMRALSSEYDHLIYGNKICAENKIWREIIEIRGQ